MLLHTLEFIHKTSLSIKKAALRCKAALSIFFRLYSLLRFEVTAQPLLKALHNKAFRYAIMFQRFGRHTPLPALYYILYAILENMSIPLKNQKNL